MHEQSLMKDIVNKLRTIASEQGVNNFTKVSLKLGALAHISPEHLTEHFVDAVKGTPAEGSQVDIIQDTDINASDAQDITLVSVDFM